MIASPEKRIGLVPQLGGVPIPKTLCATEPYLVYVLLN